MAIACRYSNRIGDTRHWGRYLSLGIGPISDLPTAVIAPAVNRSRDRCGT